MNPTLSQLYQVCGEAVAIYFRAAPNRELRLTAHGWLAATGEPYADFNQALIDTSSDAEGQLRAFHQTLHTRNLPALYFLTPAVADSLAATATALGMTAAGKAPLMVCAAEDLPDPASGHYMIQRVATAADQEAVCTILAQAFGLSQAALTQVLNITQLAGPGFTAYLAYQGEQPVSTVATTVTGPLVGIWSMGTRPACQRQGAGRALLGQVMAQQRACGAKYFYLWSTEAGQRLYRQLGYHTVAEFSVWATGPTVQVHG